MTREEVINVLKKYDVYGCGVCLQDDLQNNLDAKEALDMAIELLSNDTTEKPNDTVEQKNDVVAEPTDLISRADAIEAVEAKIKWFDGDAIEDRCKRDAFIQVLDEILTELPSADRPSGEWINEWKDIDGGRMYGACCSVCHTIGHTGYNYCPNCGAKMGSGFQ